MLVFFGSVITFIEHHQIEEDIKFKNIYFLSSKSKYELFYSLMSFMCVYFSTYLGKYDCNS